MFKQIFSLCCKLERVCKVSQSFRREQFGQISGEKIKTLNGAPRNCVNYPTLIAWHQGVDELMSCDDDERCIKQILGRHPV